MVPSNIVIRESLVPCVEDEDCTHTGLFYTRPISAPFATPRIAGSPVSDDGGGVIEHRNGLQICGRHATGSHESGQE
jgi:hypothetical protein